MSKCHIAGNHMSRLIYHANVSSGARALNCSLMPATKALRSLYICGGSPKHSLLINAICSEILRVKSGIFGQTAKFGQRLSLFNISNIGIKNKLTKQAVKILMRVSPGYTLFANGGPNLPVVRIYPTLPYCLVSATTVTAYCTVYRHQTELIHTFIYFPVDQP